MKICMSKCRVNKYTEPMACRINKYIYWIGPSRSRCSSLFRVIDFNNSNNARNSEKEKKLRYKCINRRNRNRLRKLRAFSYSLLAFIEYECFSAIATIANWHVFKFAVKIFYSYRCYSYQCISFKTYFTVEIINGCWFL